VIIDTSAIVAVIRGEPEADVFRDWIVRAPVRRMSAASYVEVSAVIDGRRNPMLSAALDQLIREMRVEITPFTARQAAIAREAYQRFGRGSGHPARLNMGDCFSYALARDLGEPLLFKGEDFALTDIELLVEPVKGRRLSEILAAYGAASAG
jgi:ribonuclease VapC